MANLWQIESGATYNVALDLAPRWLAPDQRARWEQLRGARALYEGRHRCYFLDEGRSQFNFPQAQVQDRLIRPYVTVNLLRLISLKTADLLFGAKPKIDATSISQKFWLDQLARRSLIYSRFHQGAIHASWSGGGFLEATLWGGGYGYLELVEPDDIYPVGVPGPDGQFASYVRYATQNIGTPQAPVTLLLKTIYEPGEIHRRLSQLDQNGNVVVDNVRLDAWPAFQGAVPPPDEQTGLPDRNTIIYIPNVVGEKLGLSDYDGLIELQDAVNAKFAQIARVLAKHSDPKLAAPESMADPRGNLSAMADVFFIRSKDEIPSYITWSAELDAAMRDRDSVVDALLAQAEMSKVILGIERGGGVPDSARKLRLTATNTLAKVGRKVLVFEPVIALAVETVQRLETSGRGPLRYAVEPVGVHMRDGMPVDGIDQATEASTWRGAGLMSIEAGVEMRVEDADAAAIEVQRIKDENAAAMPASLMGESPAAAADAAATAAAQRAEHYDRQEDPTPEASARAA